MFYTEPRLDFSPLTGIIINVYKYSLCLIYILDHNILKRNTMSLIASSCEMLITRNMLVVKNDFFNGIFLLQELFARISKLKRMIVLHT